MRSHRSMLKLAQEYLAYRRNLGYKLKITGYQLLSFARFADQIKHCGPITTELAIQWACLPENASPIYPARRLEVVRCFAKYRAIFDSNTQIPPDGILGPAHRRTQPHIYSNQQIAQLLRAAAKFSPVGGLRPRTYVTLLGLLACSGLRISEALALTRRDVDLERQTLVIRESKFHKSRLVPIHPSACRSLLKYARFRDRRWQMSMTPAFFLAERGTPLKYSTVNMTFRKLCDGLGWDLPRGRRRPRIHDLRHTFACRSLLKWHKEGRDIEHAVAALSTYLGHVKVTDTYWYLTGIPELFAVTARNFERFTRSTQGGA